MTIYATFPGTGKTYIADRNPDVLDSDSSKFKTPDWPKSYLDHIEQACIRNERGIIFCSTHREVLLGLSLRRLPYVLAYPDYTLKDEYLKRYRRRGSPEEFIDLMSYRWHDFMNDMLIATPKKRAVLHRGEFLSDLMSTGRLGE